MPSCYINRESFASMMSNTEIMDKRKLKTEIQNGENIHLSRDSPTA